MNIRLLFTLAALAIGLATQALAQEQKTVDPEVRRRERNKKEGGGVNKHDAADWCAFYTEFAIDVWSLQAEGAAVGLPAIKKKYEAHFATHPAPQSFKVVQVYAIANKICAIMDYTDHRYSKGQALVIYVLDADGDWKVRLSYLL